MKIRILYQILLLFIPLLISAQNFELKKPNVSELKRKAELSKHTEEVIHLYFINNYKSTSEKTSVKKYNYPDYSICSFEQTFENEIKYYKNECQEAGGISIRVTLPKIQIDKVKKWIEEMYKAESSEIKNKWYNVKNIYGPIDEEVGCYYEIKPEKDSWVIDIYCGC
ncbi:hypothetical protein [Flavobacterium sp.]|uniref:hypothetical protein n=1 Tax=Flavobacterium sp. TaxID=239 RepID=UPI003D2A5392